MKKIDNVKSKINNMKNLYKSGDRILVKDFFGNIYACTILAVLHDWLGTKYLCRWIVHDCDYGEYHTTLGIKRAWKVVVGIKE